MKIGLVGFGGSGKTTVFNALTGQDVATGYGSEVHRGVVKVPDIRVDKLSEIFTPKKTTFAEVAFCDVPGEHGGDRKGLSRQGLQHIRDQDALCLVLRDFENPALESAPDPASELEAFHAECILADLEIVERRLDRMKREKTDPLEKEQFEKLYETLSEEKPLRLLDDKEIHRPTLRGYAFLTDKPLLAVVNTTEDKAASELPAELSARLGEMGSQGLALSASVEAEIAQLDADDQAAFLEDMGMETPALHRFIRAAFQLLDLICFFTVGEDEVRAWTITRGTNAQNAAGRIHSDLARGFIRAEIFPYETFIEYGSEQKLKEAGKLQLEGKEYVVSDGEIMHVRFNV